LEDGMADQSKIVVGFWRRLFADLIDAVCLGVPGYGLGYLFRYQLSTMGLHSLWIGLACGLMYYGLFHSRPGHGQTPGKRLLGIQVLRRDGGYLGLGSSFLRYIVVSFVFYNPLYGSLAGYLPADTMMAVGSVFLLLVVWAFFACFLMIPIHPLKRGLHDLAAGSIVVYRGKYDAEALAKMDDPAKSRRAWLILACISAIVAGVLFYGLYKVEKTMVSDLGELTAMQKALQDEYDVRTVNVSTFNGKPNGLTIGIWLPMKQYEDRDYSERLREDVKRKVKARFPDVEKYGGLRVKTMSGFNIGIANMNLNDTGKD
jgi:uncharacterized RDD family membrane protein YckC